MRFVIKTAEEQWKEVLENFIKSGKKVEAIECDSYGDERSMIETARRYIKHFELPIRITVLFGIARFERTDM